MLRPYMSVLPEKLQDDVLSASNFIGKFQDVSRRSGAKRSGPNSSNALPLDYVEVDKR